MKCLIYSRVSTQDQTTENQIIQLKEYAAKQEWEIVEIITDVCSGGKAAEERQGLNKVFTMAHKKLFDVVLFYSLCRLSREGVRETLTYLTRLNDCGIKWHSYTELYLSSLGVFADAIVALMATLAKQERIRISERTKAGLARVKAKGVKLGRSNIMEAIKNDYTALGLVGESHNKLMAYLAAVSRKMDNPLNILVLSSSGAGKSALIDKTVKLTPPEDVIRTSSISNKALFYMESLKDKLLVLEEAAGMNDTYAIRTLISEGYLSLETVSGGKLKSKRVEGGCSVFQSTTNPEINAETKSRFFCVGICESREQTRKILASQRKSYTLEGLIGNMEEQNIIHKHHTFQRMLKKLPVVNPYAEYIQYSDDRLNARRDQIKLLMPCRHTLKSASEGR
jgi:DNA invertase Pin-like site-specific DNA recombinase